MEFFNRPKRMTLLNGKLLITTHTFFDGRYAWEEQPVGSSVKPSFVRFGPVMDATASGVGAQKFGLFEPTLLVRRRGEES